MNLNTKTLRILAYPFLGIPVAIFLLTWTKLYIGIPSTVLLIISIVSALRKTNESDYQLYISWKVLLLVLLVALAWTYSSGIGGFVYQRFDWHARNALMHDLIEYNWPVIYPSGKGLSYYLTYWMVPALVGKLFGFYAANIILYLYSAIGVSIVMLLLISLFVDENGKISAKKSAVVMIFMILWGGMDALAQYLIYFGLGKGSLALEAVYAWSVYQYTPHNGIIEWVFNQGIPAWIGTLLYLRERKKKSVDCYGIIVMLMLAHCPFSAVGITAIMFVDVVMFKINGGLSVSNITAVLGVLPVYWAYYSMNEAVSNGSDSGGFGLFIAPENFGPFRIATFLLFIALEVLIYGALVLKDNRKDHLFWTVIVVLSLIPLFSVGGGRDFLMRASIPGFVILMTYVVSTVLNKDYRKTLRFKLLCICVFIGFYAGVADFIITAKNTMNPQIENVADNVKSMEYSMDDEFYRDYMVNSSYLVDEPEQTIFFNWFAR